MYIAVKVPFWRDSFAKNSPRQTMLENYEGNTPEQGHVTAFS